MRLFLSFCRQKVSVSDVCQLHEAFFHSSFSVFLWYYSSWLKVKTCTIIDSVISAPCAMRGALFLWAIKMSSFTFLPLLLSFPHHVLPHFCSSILHLSLFRCEVENRYQGNPLKGTCYCKWNSNYQLQWKCGVGGGITLRNHCEALLFSLVQASAKTVTWLLNQSRSQVVWCLKK